VAKSRELMRLKLKGKSSGRKVKQIGVRFEVSGLTIKRTIFFSYPR